jgi:alpha-L-arabinofuranosidase
VTVYLKRGDTGTAGDGGKGDWILSWQAFLAGQGIYVGDYSPNFGPKTEAATERAQAAWCTQIDGMVGDGTTDAAEARGFTPPWRAVQLELVCLSDEEDGFMDPSYPQPADLDGDGRADLVYLSEDERQELWGPLEYKVVAGKPVLTNDWYSKNIVTIKIPQLVGVDVYGTPSSGRCQCHKLAAAQLLGAFQEADEEGFADLLLTYGGTYNMRFIRGSTTTLSNHAFAVAIDLNMTWNGLGKQPAMVGQKGSLRQMVSIFESWGFYWGGWYRSRKDGQHLECVKRLESTELRKKVNALSTNDHILPWVEAA